MKTPKLSFKSRFLLNVLYPASLLIALSACDSLESDSSPKAPAGSSSKIYVQSNGSAIIDLSTIVKSDEQATVAVTSTTREGTLSDLGSGILQYSPNSSTSAKDGFEITVTTSDNAIQKDSVIIIIEDSLDLPCGIYPKEDIVFGASKDSAYSVNVLSNDLICGYTIDELQLSIHSGESLPPYVGTARIEGNTIIYTPSQSFSSADKIVYKISVKNNPAIVAYGLVYITGQSTCDFTVNPDSVISNEEFTQIRINGVENDDLCNAVNNFQFNISSAPSKGSVYIESNEFVYSPKNLATGGFTDAFEYTICIDGNCKTTTVTIAVDTE